MDLEGAFHICWLSTPHLQVILLYSYTLLIFTYKVYSVIIFGNCLIISVYVLQLISNIVGHCFCIYLRNNLRNFSKQNWLKLIHIHLHIGWHFFSILQLLDQWDGLASKDACCKPDNLSWTPQDPYNVKTELTPSNYSTFLWTTLTIFWYLLRVK